MKIIKNKMLTLKLLINQFNLLVKLMRILITLYSKTNKNMNELIF